MTYSALGYHASIRIMGQEAGVDVPVEQWMHDAVSIAAKEAGQQFPALLSKQVLPALMPVLQKDVLPPLLRQVENEFTQKILPQVRQEIDRTITVVTWRAGALGVLLSGAILASAYYQRNGMPSLAKLRRKKG